MLSLFTLLTFLCVGSSIERYGRVDGQFVTQTVYGFLDFTTTMGNTVMVFSPESAPPPESPKARAPINENIIETKPPPSTVTNVELGTIKPSRINYVEKANKLIDKTVVSSVVTVVSVPPKKEEKQITIPKPVFKEQKQTITKVEIIPGPTKVIENNVVIHSSLNTNKQKTEQTNKNRNVNEIKESNIISSKDENQHNSNFKMKKNSENNSKRNVAKPAILVPNSNIRDPEYDFLSRQPSEFVEETYRVVDVRPSKSHSHKQKHAPKNKLQPTPPIDDDEHPLGLVTTLRGTIVNDGTTTVHETSVIGTFISGKYAQVLNSNSKIMQPSGPKQKISPTATQKITKTIAPAMVKNYRQNLEPTPSISEEDSGNTKITRRNGNNVSSFKNRHRPQDSSDAAAYTPPNKKYKNKNSSPTQRFQSETTTSFNNRRKLSRSASFKSASVPTISGDFPSKRGFKHRVQSTSVEPVTPVASTSIYKFKLNRSPGSGRWQYKTSPKPKVTIRKMIGEDEVQQTTANINPLLEETQINDISPQARSDNDLELSGSQREQGEISDAYSDDNSIEKLPPVETLKVEISTPADFQDIYYEIATIKMPYTFQVGRVKNTRIITVTTTIQKRIEPSSIFHSENLLNEPLTENILATKSPFEKDHNLLDSSIATLPPITLSSDMETPPLETLTETFSTTQNMLKTHILPVVKDSNITSTLTLTQTYHVTRFVTAIKTLPPMEFYQFIPSKTLKEFNSHLEEAGSELHLELDFGDNNEDEDGVPRRVYLPDLDLANIGSEFDLAEVDKYRVAENHLRLKKAHGQNKINQLNDSPKPISPALTPEQAQQLAFLRLLNPAAAAQIPDVVTTSKPVLKFETIYESHVIPVFDGKSTVQSTISRPVATITRTEYEIGTSSLPALPIQPINPLNPLLPPQYTITSTPVVINTQVVATDSQTLKLTFGAKTILTTLFSTKIVPTAVTSYVTTSVPVLPSAGFPGFYAPPFAPFPYVG